MYGRRPPEQPQRAGRLRRRRRLDLALYVAGLAVAFTAMFKAVEDRIGVASDAEYGVGTIMVVEDSVKFYSSFLPTLTELWRQNAEIAGETMHMRGASCGCTRGPRCSSAPTTRRRWTCTTGTATTCSA